MACSEVAVLQTAGAYYSSKFSGQQCHDSLVFAAWQVANNLSPIAKKL